MNEGEQPVSDEATIQELKQEIDDNYKTIAQIEGWCDYWREKVVADGARHKEEIASLHASCETFQRVEELEADKEGTPALGGSPGSRVHR